MQQAQECNVCRHVVFSTGYNLNSKTKEYYKTCNVCRENIEYRKKEKEINKLIQKEAKKEIKKNTTVKGKK